MPGQRRAEGDGDAFQVAHLAEQYHIRVLAQSMLERHIEADGVDADFALLDHRFAIPINILDRVFDRHDVLAAGPVDGFDQRGHGGGLARARRAGDQDHAAARFGQPVHRRRQAQVGETKILGLQAAQRHADRPALIISVAAETGGGIGRKREVQGAVAIPGCAQPLGNGLGQERKELLALHRLALDRSQPAVDAIHRRGVLLEMQVRGAMARHFLEKFLNAD
ncbi:MAG: hypothetical protein BWZ10_00791 [candidate division BRC1 bacterium ADurb.BinA364]|nr:MAG: hypothetical protein BWZ10_00791 [candidate division BRC1 bacterium ADurb.BinA364]